MNRPLVVSIITIVSFAVISCVPPTGYVDGDDIPISDYDDFWTVPRRDMYNLGDSFEKANDLWVFASSRGIVQSVSVDKVEIGIVKNPNAAEPDEPIIITNGAYRLVATVVGVGRKLVVVSYGDKIAKYSIEVVDPSGVYEPDNPGESEGPGINIIWAK